MQTILYVDDQADSLAACKALLATHRRKVLCASTGREVLALANEHGADLILLDLDLPDVGGLVVLQRLKQAVKTRAIPVIAVSAQSIEDMPKSQRGLIAAYVMKPVDPPPFVRLVERVLEGPSVRAASPRAKADMASESRFWRCAACASGWLRPRGDLVDGNARCIRCDGPLALIEAPSGSPNREDRSKELLPSRVPSA